MNVTGIYQDDTMLQQISEAVRIRNTNPENLLNIKSEWNIQNIPQVIITRTENTGQQQLWLGLTTNPVIISMSIFT